MSKSLTDKALQDAAKILGVELAVIRAVDEVESSGEGFLPDGHVKILFERHKFHQFTKGKYDQSHPNISNEKAGGYGSSKSQYGRFSKAFELDKEAAMKSASWGRYQIMGFNYADAGFGSVGSFVDAMKTGEDAQLKAFVNIIRSWGLAPELREHKWASFARQYNGPAYKRNKYDEKLAAAYARFEGTAGTLVIDEATEEPKGIPVVVPAFPDETPAPPQPEKKPEPLPQPAPDVPDVVVTAEQPKETNPKEKAEVSGPKSWIAAATTFLTAAGGGIVSWAQGASTVIIVGFFCAAGAVGIVYVVSRYWYRNKENQRLAEVQLAREKMAHELTVLKVKSAMDRNANTVGIANP